MSSIGFTFSTVVTAVVISVTVGLLLCTIGVLTSSVVVLRCTHCRRHPSKDAEDDKQRADIVYDELMHTGMNPHQIMMKDNNAYGEFTTSMV